MNIIYATFALICSDVFNVNKIALNTTAPFITLCSKVACYIILQNMCSWSFKFEPKMMNVNVYYLIHFQTIIASFWKYNKFN